MLREQQYDIFSPERLGGIDPDKVEAFIYGSSGKPSVLSSLHFNLAHSHGRALLAICNSAEVGIDLEWIDSKVEIEDIAERFFTPEECSEMMALAGHDRMTELFDLWCCKEAYLKAIGVGISGGLNQCRIMNALDGTAAVHNPTDPEATSLWKIHRVSIRGPDLQARCVFIPDMYH